MFFEKIEHDIRLKFHGYEDIALLSIKVFMKIYNLTILNKNHDDQNPLK